MKHFLAITIIALALLVAVHAAESRYGADANDTGNPIGGGKGYSRIVTGGDVQVSTIEQLIATLKAARRGQVVFVAAAQLDLTGAPPLQVPEGVTLAGNRGHNSAPGPLLKFNHPGKSGITVLAGSRVTGLRLQGGDGPAITAEGKRAEKKTGAIAIAARGDKVEVDNCESFEFHHSGVNVQARETHVHHCDLHDIHAYPVVVGDKAGLPVLIEANVIRYTWHAVAGTGKHGTGYEARFNLVKEASPKVYHDYNLGRNTFAFDMHEYRPALPAKWLAATRVHVHHNTVLDLDKGQGIAPPSPGVVIRGIPLEGVEVHHNWFVHHADPQRIFQQRNANGNCRVHDNIHGPDRKPVPEDLFKKNAERAIIEP